MSLQLEFAPRLERFRLTDYVRFDFTKRTWATRPKIRTGVVLVRDSSVGLRVAFLDGKTIWVEPSALIPDGPCRRALRGMLAW